ncbi:MAG: D-alanyl-D-alanine carboxypeptidase [Defluviitaleaceae bacterium]|nr:D-alanyl-D-alanine carboxypeptidase [Defluviitaleaceae bacterium]
MKKFIAAMLISIFSATAAQAAEITPPTVDAAGAVLMDASTGRVLWGKNEHNPLAMASTTKIMTSIIALESGRIDETVTVSKKAAAAPKVKMYLSPGEKIRLGDLMLALMLESSNDAAIAIAEHLSGSVEAFCAEMTAKAHALGATNTIFETPNGLDAGQHQSTAYDLAIITRYALNVPGFMELTNRKSATFSSNTRSYTMNNKNRLLSEYSGANGVKTGFTNKAGHCFVGAAKREGMQLISVVLASGWGDRGRNQKWVDTKEILNFGFGNYAFHTIIEAGTPAGALPVTRSRTPSASFAFNQELTLPLASHEKETIKISLEIPHSIQAPITPGQPIGTATIQISNETYQIPLTTTSAATRHDLKTSIEKILNAYIGQITNTKVDIILPEIYN